MIGMPVAVPCGIRGSLTIVGTGIQATAHISAAAVAAICQADKLYFAVADVITAQWLAALNSTAESLLPKYPAHRVQRVHVYHEWVERMLASVRAGLRVCGAFYGHPGVFVYATHEVIRRVRQEGFPAEMLPAVSALDCLFADLGLDPAQEGFQTFDATDFLVRRRLISPHTGLILWQVALIGDETWCRSGWSLKGLRMLTNTLARKYGASHRVCIYEAAARPSALPVVRFVPLDRLAEQQITGATILYVPPVSPAPIDPEVMSQLGLPLPAERHPVVAKTR
jgi:uncharacterized protein YabN with tetrapyrrole methylase and pyrophosphatase domain